MLLWPFHNPNTVPTRIRIIQTEIQTEIQTIQTIQSGIQTEIQTVRKNLNNSILNSNHSNLNSNHLNLNLIIWTWIQIIRIIWTEIWAIGTGSQIIQTENQIWIVRLKFKPFELEFEFESFELKLEPFEQELESFKLKFEFKSFELKFNYSIEVRFKALIWLAGLGFIEVGLGVNLGCC